MQEQSSTANSSQFNDYRVAGNLGNTAGELLSFPTGIAVDSKGDVLFSDTANDLIRQVVEPASK